MKLYRVKTVAEKLNKHEVTIRRLVSEGKIKVVRIDKKHIRIAEDELNRLMEESL